MDISSKIRDALGKARRVEYFDTINSTNAELIERVKNGGASCGDVIAAGSQSAGRGRRGKSFSSLPGGVYFSFVAENGKGALVTVKAGVAVAEALESYGASPSIKWVNDVLIGGRKVCGILAEAVAGTSLAVVGIGINLESGAIPEELSSVASALDLVITPPDPAELISKIITNYEALEPSGVIPEYRRRLKFLGGKVEIKSTGECATALDVGPLGELIVRCGDGTIKSLNSGEISISVR